MMNLPRWRVILCVAAIIFGIVFTLPNALPASTASSLPSWVPHQRLNLGLDLQGGSLLLLQVDTASLKTERLANIIEDVQNTLHDQKIAFTSPVQSNGQVLVRITDPAQVDAARAALQKLSQPLANGGGRDLSVQEGPDQHIVLALSDQAIAADTAHAVQQSIEIIRKRIDALGTKEPSIAPQGTDRIVVEAPGESDPERLKTVIGQTAKLTFQLVDESVTPQDLAQGHPVPPESVVLPSQDNLAPSYLVKRRPVVSGDMLTSAQMSFNPQTSAPVVVIRFNGQGSRRWGDATTENVQKRFAIVLDNKILSAPVIREPILGGTSEISGNFTTESANDLAVLLNAGALPAKLNFVEQTTVGAELGADSVKAGALSAVIAIGLIGTFMILAYGVVFGGFALVGLISNMTMILGAMSLTGATLTLPGIAGLILTIAMAVDANVLIFERIRDEERAGRKPLMAIETGFTRATVSILDANITTLIAALILFTFGAGPVKGFAWTLSIGVLTSVFAALFLTRLFVALWFRSSRAKRLPI
ncbi:MAG TPA: protein translocase subunit SecD [Caulobacteraceae bacterium]|jgi:preprotein translocase subunit SecD|nr:protein translocase subunit SecD [Caulobacteraceae bacterium]